MFWNGCFQSSLQGHCKLCWVLTFTPNYINYRVKQLLNVCFVQMIPNNDILWPLNYFRVFKEILTNTQLTLKQEINFSIRPDQGAAILSSERWGTCDKGCKSLNIFAFPLSSIVKLYSRIRCFRLHYQWKRLIHIYPSLISHIFRKLLVCFYNDDPAMSKPMRISWLVGSSFYKVPF